MAVTSKSGEFGDKGLVSKTNGFDTMEGAWRSQMPFREIVFQVVYEVLPGDHSYGNVFTVLSEVVVFLQLLYFPFAAEGKFAWTSEIADIGDDYFGLLVGAKFVTAGSKAFGTVWSGTIIALALTIIGLGYLAYKVGNRGKPSEKLIRVMRFAALLNTMVYVPMLYTAMQTVQCSDVVRDLLGCEDQTTLQLLLRVLGVGIMIPFALVSVLFQFLGPRRNPFAKDIGACPHGRAHALRAILQTILVAMFVLFGAKHERGEWDKSTMTESMRMVLITCVFFSSLALFAAFFLFLPYYSLWMNCLVLSMTSVFVWASVCLVAAEILGSESDYGSMMLLLLCFPLVIYCTVYQARVRYRYLRDVQPMSEIKNPYLVEVKLRSFQEEEAKTNKKVKEEDKNTWTECKDRYKEAMEQIPRNAFLHLHLAMLCDAWNASEILSLRLRDETRAFDKNLDIKYFLYWSDMENRKRIVKSKKDTSFRNFENDLAKVKENLELVLQESLQFWTLIFKGALTMADLLQKGALVHQLKDSLRAGFAKLLANEADSSEVVTLYSQFCELVLEDAELGVSVRSAFEKRIQEFGANALCVISCTEDNLGTILAVTEGLCLLLGYDKSALIGKNVNMLAPHPVNKNHDSYLRRFRTSENRIKNIDRRIDALHSNGDIVPLNLKIAPIITMDLELHAIGRLAPREDELIGTSTLRAHAALQKRNDRQFNFERRVSSASTLSSNSGGTATTSNTASTNYTSNLIRLINHKSSSVSRFQQFGRIQLFGIYTISIVQAFLTMKAYKTISEEYTLIRISHERALGTATIDLLTSYFFGGHSKCINLSQWVPSTSELAATFQSTISSVKEMHNNLDLASSLAPSESLSFAERLEYRITMESNITREVSLGILQLEYYAVATTLANHLPECGRECVYILRNGPNDLRQSTLDVSEFYFDNGLEMLDWVNAVDFGVMIMVLILLVLSVLFGYMPIIRYQRYSQTRMRDSFVSIPKSVSRGKVEEFMNKIIHLRSVTGSNNSKDAKQFDFVEEDEESSIESEFGMESSKTDEKIAGKQQRSNRGGRYLIMFFCMQCVTVLLWFVLGYFLGRKEHEGHISAFSALHLSGLRARQVQSLNLRLNAMASMCCNDSEVTNFYERNYLDSLETVSAVYQDLIKTDDALKFGDASIGLRPSALSEGVVHSLQYENGCIGACVEVSNVREAELLSQGLQLAMETYLVEAFAEIDHFFSGSASCEDFNATWTPYMIDTLKRITVEQELKARAEVDEFISKNVNFLLTFLCAVLLVYLFTSRAFVQIERQVKRSQMVLLMLPPVLLKEKLLELKLL